MLGRKWFIPAVIAIVLLIGVGALLLWPRTETPMAEKPSPAPATVVERPATPPATPQPAPQEVDPLTAALNRAAQGDLDGAQMEIEALHQEQPNASGPHLGLAEIAIRRGDIDGAESWIAKGLAVAPDAPELYRAQARLRILQKRESDAIAAFETAIARAPKDPRSYIELANLYATRLDQLDKAVQTFNAALAVDPKNATAHFGLGVALARMKRDDAAKAALVAAQKLAPTNPMPIFTIGQIYASEKRFTEALAAFDGALKIRPTLIVARIARGDVFQGLQKYDEAIGEYREILKVDPKSVRALLGVAMSQQAAGREADAQQSYRAVLAVDPEQALALNNLAWSWAIEKRNLDEALQFAKKAVEVAQGQAPFRDTLGWVHFHRGEFTDAAKELELALQQQPNAPTYTHLGAVRAAQGDKPAAVAAYRKALDLSPDFKPAIEGLSQVQ